MHWYLAVGLSCPILIIGFWIFMILSILYEFCKAYIEERKTECPEWISKLDLDGEHFTGSILMGLLGIFLWPIYFAFFIGWGILYLLRLNHRLQNKLTKED